MKTLRMLLGAALAFAILLPMSVQAGDTPTREWGRDQAGTVRPDGIIPVPDHSRGTLDVEVWVRGGDDRIYRPGDNVTVYFRTSRDAYVLLYNVDTEGRVHQLYPRSRWDDQYVEAGVTNVVPGRGAGYRLMVTGPPGREDIVAIASDHPIAGRWDTSWDGIAGRNDYDELGGTRFRTGRFGPDRLGEIDRLGQKLVEVPVEHGDGCVTASDRVTIRVGPSQSFGNRGRCDNDDRYYGRRRHNRW